ncbi:hypothetical protein CkaCkLH20_09622 [Colletotrichum karsti]|uniref:LITAF domain-containing protein n=1 Tax=Colletotrichum karsti TaxID=1095194 RepID=A0A9P6LE51_9PEZI|nr:uncharacterized protein CkaCkLH20_09622 [Colletotrichum karsti]KAF9872759.1 hypothetical protein CkaCkLH20_09622 [Colletotrichum karsti]
MAQPQPVSVVDTPDAAIQQPSPAHDRDPILAAQNSGPAPITELPTNLNNSGPTTATSHPVNEKGGDPNMMAPPMIQGVTPLHMLGDSPQWIDCPFCMKRTLTTINTEGTGMQMVAGWCEDTHFSCSNCHKRVATRPYDGPIQVYGPQGPMYPVVPSQYEPTAPPVPEQQSPPMYK